MEKQRGVDSVKVVSLIETVVVIGNGSKENPHRNLVQYWDMRGVLIAEKDPFLEKEKEQPKLLQDN